MSKGAQIAGGATVIALLLGWYAATNLDAGASFTYYQNLAEFQVGGDEHLDAPARVHGYVSLGTIDRDVASYQVRFAIQNDAPHGGGSADDALRVVFSSLETPDLFKDGAEVVVEGRLARDESGGIFYADRLLAKCPSKFEAEAASGGSASF